MQASIGCLHPVDHVTAGPAKAGAAGRAWHLSRRSLRLACSREIVSPRAVERAGGETVDPVQAAR